MSEKGTLEWWREESEAWRANVMRLEIASNKLRARVARLEEALKIYANPDRWSRALIVDDEKPVGVATFQLLNGKSFEYAQEALKGEE